MTTSIGDRIRELRNSRNMTQDELAEAAEINRVSVAKYEAGIVRPTAKNLAKLSAALGVTSDYILGQSEEEAAASGVDISGVEFALNSEIKEMTEEEKQDVLDYVRFKRSQRKK